MVGMLSLLDALLGEPLADIVARMSLHEEVESALLLHEGNLGDLLTLCEKIETGDIAAIQEKLLTRPSITVDILNKAQLEALGWANNIAM